jgi:P-type conjugative transfer protein TrbJ
MRIHLRTPRWSRLVQRHSDRREKRHGAARGVRTRVLLVVVATVTAMALPRPARAQFGGIVFDPVNLARNILHYVRRIEQEAMQAHQLEQQLLAMRKLSNPPWRDIQATMNQLSALMSDSRTMAYQLQGLTQQFHTTFPVSQTFQSWPTERRAQAERTVATMGTTLAGAQVQAQVFPNGLARLAAMKGSVASAQGHEQSLELQNTATVFSAEELMLLRQAVMAQSAMQAVYYADRVNRDEQQATTIESRLAALSVPARRSAPISLRITP